MCGGGVCAPPGLSPGTGSAATAAARWCWLPPGLGEKNGGLGAAGGGFGVEHMELYPNTPRGSGALRAGGVGGARCHLGQLSWGTPNLCSCAKISPLAGGSLPAPPGDPKLEVFTCYFRAVWRRKLLRPQPAGAGSSAGLGVGSPVLCAGWGRGAGLCTLPERLKTPEPTRCTPRSHPPHGKWLGRGGFTNPNRRGLPLPPPCTGKGPKADALRPCRRSGTSPRTARGPAEIGERGLCGAPTYSSMSIGQESGTAAAWRGESRRQVVSPGGYPVLARCWEGMSPQNIPTCSPR